MTGIGRRHSATRSGPLRAVVAAETVSALGSQITYLAVPWFVLTTTGSVTLMGLVFAAELLPVALLGIPSALLVQRYGVRRVMVLCDLLRAPLVCAIPVLHLLGLLTLPAILVVAFALGTCGAPYLSAQRLVLPELFGEDEALIVQGNGLIEGATRLATLAGPAVAGVAIAAAGPVDVLWIDGGTFLAAAALLYVWLPRQAVAAADVDRGGMFQGAAFVLRDRLLRRVGAASLLFGFFFPLLLACVPVLAVQRYAADPRAAGLLLAAWGAGAVAGTLGVLRYAQRIAPLRLGALAAVCMALPLWLLGLPLGAWQAALILLVSGVFTPMLNAPLITLLLLRSPEELRAKVMAFMMTASLLAGPLGYVAAGPALALWGLTSALLVVAAGVSLAAILLVTMAGTRTD